jgi:hypothetical protein
MHVLVLLRVGVDHDLAMYLRALAASASDYYYFDCMGTGDIPQQDRHGLLERPSLDYAISR